MRSCFDYVDVVVAPVLIGGKETASLIDGSSILSENELSKMGVLKLIECTVLNDSYIRVRYQIASLTTFSLVEIEIMRLFEVYEECREKKRNGLRGRIAKQKVVKCILEIERLEKH